MRKILTIILPLFFTLILSQIVSATGNTLKVEVSNRSEGIVPAPVKVDGTDMFPISRILNVLDISGTETVDRSQAPTRSFVTFRGDCYAISSGKTEVTEFKVDESGACFEPTGNVYKLEKAAIYPQGSSNIFVPLSFISENVVGSQNDTIYHPEESILVFNMYSWDEPDKESKANTPSYTPTGPIVNPVTLAMKINSPWLLTKDNGKMFDDDHRVTPLIKNGTTLLPIAPIIERLGGKTEWNGNERKITITLNQDTIELWIDKKSALVNHVKKDMTVAPSVINGKTMIPLRFVSENLGAKVLWDGSSQMVLVYYGGAQGNETDFFEYNFKISTLAAFQKQEDNRATVEDLEKMVKENQQKHDQVKYNNNDPLDYYGKMIHVGDIVESSGFDGVVKKVSGTQILVYWNHTNFLMIETGKEKETAAKLGIKWLSEQWIEAKTVVVSSSGN